MSNKQYKYGFVLTGDSKGAVKAMRDVETGYQKSAKGADRFTKSNKSAVSSLKALVALNATGYLASFARSMTDTVKTTIDFADRVQKLSIRLGMSTNALSEFQHVADLTGVTFNTMTMAFQRQSRRIAEASQGTGEAVNALNELGLSAVKLNQVKPEQQLEVLADAMAGVTNQSDKVRLAMKLWDSEGVAMLQTINGGSEAIRGMRNEAEALGKSIDSDTADAMAGMNDSFVRLHANISGTATQLLAEFSPAIIKMNTYLIENMDTIGNVSKAFIAAFEPAIYVVGTLFDGVVLLTGALVDYAPVVATASAMMLSYSAATTTAAAANTAYGASFSKIKKGFMLFAAFTAGWSIGTYLREEFLEVRLAGIAMVNGLLKGANYLKSGFEIAWAGIKLPFDGLITYVQTKFSALVSGLADMLDKLPGFMAMPELVDGFRTFADNVEPAEDAVTRFNKTMKASLKELKTGNDVVDDITSSMVDYEISVVKSSKATEKNNKVQGDFSGVTEKSNNKIEKQIELFGNLTPAVEKYEELMLGITREKRQLNEDLWAAEDLFQAGIIESIEQLELYQQKLHEVYKQSLTETKKHEKAVKEDVPQAYKNAASSIQNSFGDLFEDVFDGGENAMDNFADNIENTFKNLLKEMAVMAITQPIIVPMVQQMGGVMGLSGNQIGQTVTQLGGNPQNMLGGVSDTLIQNGISTGVQSAFSGAGLNAAITGLGNSIGIGGTFAGMGAPTTAYGAMVGFEGAAITGTGAMGAIGAAVPYIGWAIAIASMLGAFDADTDTTPDLNLWSRSANPAANVNRPRGGGVTNYGEDEDGRFDPLVEYSGRFSGFAFSTQHDAFGSEQEVNDFSNAIITRFSNLENTIFSAFGEDVSQQILDSMSDVYSEIRFEDFSGSDDFEAAVRGLFNQVFAGVGRIADEEVARIQGVYGSFLNSTGELDTAVAAASTIYSLSQNIDRSFDGILYTMNAFVQGADGVEQQLSEISATAALLSLDAVNHDFHEFMQTVYAANTTAGVFDETAEEYLRLGTNLLSVNNILETIHLSAYDLTLAGADLADQLTTAAGGLDALNAGTSFYYTHFFTEEEQRNDFLSNTADSVNDFNTTFGEFGTLTLGSNASLRQFIDSLGAITDENQDAFLAAIALAPAIYASTEAIDDMAQAATDAAEEAARKGREEAEALARIAREEAEALQQAIAAAGVFTGSMRELSYALRGENDLDHTIRQIQDVLDEFGYIGNHATYSREQLADFVLTLDGMDTVTLDAEGRISQLANAMIHLDEIMSDAQSTIDGILYDQQIAVIDEQIKAQREQLTLARETNRLEVDRYKAAIQANETISDFLDSLKISALKNQSPAEQMQEAKKLFDEAVSNGNASDATKFGKEYLQSAQQFYASSSAYTDVYGSVTNALDGLLSDPGKDPSGQIDTTIETLSGLEKQRAELNNQLRQDALLTQNNDLIASLNIMALAKDESLFDIAQQNGIDLGELGFNLIGTLQRVNDLTLQDLARWAIAGKETSTDLAAAAGFDYERMIVRLTDQGYLLSDIRSHDESIAGSSELTNAQMLQFAINQRWSTETLASRFGTSNSEVVSYLQTQGYTLEDIKGWNASVYTANDDSNTLLRTIDQSLVDINSNTFDAATAAGYGGVYSDNQILQRIMDNLGGIGTAHLETTNSKLSELVTASWMIHDTTNRSMLNLRNISQNMTGDSYIHGTNYVPQDGLAYLHKGEAVVPVEYNHPVQLKTTGSTDTPMVEALRQEIKLLRQEVHEQAQYAARQRNENTKAVNDSGDKIIKSNRKPVSTRSM